MAKRKSRAQIKAEEFHAKVVGLLQTRHADWSEWEETFLLDNVQRPDGFEFSDAQWEVLKRLIRCAKAFTHYAEYKVHELLAIAYPFRFDLDEDGQEFLETILRWKATDLKLRQIRRLAGIARMFATIERDDLDDLPEDNQQMDDAA